MTASRTIQRREAARALMETDAEEFRMALILAAGVALGAGMPGASAAALLAAERLFPDQPLTIDGWREAQD